MKRILYLLVLCLPMVIVAERKEAEQAKNKAQAPRYYDIRKYNLDAAITIWVTKAEEDGSFGKLPNLIKRTWRRMKSKKYMVSQDDLRELSDEVFKYSMMKQRKKENGGPDTPSSQVQEKSGTASGVGKPS